MTTGLVFGGRYAEAGPIASGGAGSVVICDDPNLGRRVAIKFLQPHVNKRRIYDEIAALQRIRSKHVVEVYDLVIHQPGNQIGIVQEFLPGDDLVQTRKKEALHTAGYLRMLYQVASGLHDIHEQNVIHRDIKPNNMKFDRESLLKIFDFGLAREDGDAAHTVGFKGTHGFAAPELYAGGHVAFTKAVDVYAFAVTAAFLSEGGVPAGLVPVLSGPPNPAAWVSGGGFASLTIKMPGHIAALLDRCLAHDPANRPNIGTIRDTLAAHLLSGRHRALLTYQGRTLVCDVGNPSANVSRGANGLTIVYNNEHFVVNTVSGAAFINNHAAQPGIPIAGSCVITLGPADGASRDFITLDISHPEVVL
jgi:serine/threonine-protein kinase